MLEHLLHLLLRDIVRQIESESIVHFTSSQLQRLVCVIAMDMDLAQQFFRWIDRDYINRAINQVELQLLDMYDTFFGQSKRKIDIESLKFEQDDVCRFFKMYDIHTQQIGKLEIMLRRSLIELFKITCTDIDMTSQYREKITQIMAPEFASFRYSILVKKLKRLPPLLYWRQGVQSFVGAINDSQIQRLLMALIETENDIDNLLKQIHKLQWDMQQKQSLVKSIQDHGAILEFKDGYTEHWRARPDGFHDDVFQGVLCRNDCAVPLRWNNKLLTFTICDNIVVRPIKPIPSTNSSKYLM